MTLCAEIVLIAPKCEVRVKRLEISNAIHSCRSLPQHCGNPSGLGLQITGTFANAPPPPDLFTAVEVLINNAFLYTPSVQGAITSLSASVDKNLSPATRCCSG